MNFDPKKEYGNAVSMAYMPDGKKYIEAIIADAKKNLPPGTEYHFISWTENGKRLNGWVYNLQKERKDQKLYNPTIGGPGVNHETEPLKA